MKNKDFAPQVDKASILRADVRYFQEIICQGICCSADMFQYRQHAIFLNYLFWLKVGGPWQKKVENHWQRLTSRSHI